MKIVFLNSSGRKNGNTACLLSKIVEKLDKNRLSVEIINISEQKINYCLGCHECETLSRKCVQHDDVETIYQSFKNAEIICIASPDYWGYVTGHLKVFFERSTEYCNAIDGFTNFPAGKKGVAISLRRGSKESENIEIIKAIEHYFSHLEIEPVITAMFEGVGENSDFNKPDIIAKIDKLAGEINSYAVYGKDYSFLR